MKAAVEQQRRGLRLPAVAEQCALTVGSGYQAATDLSQLDAAMAYLRSYTAPEQIAPRNQAACLFPYSRYFLVSNACLAAKPKKESAIRPPATSSNPARKNALCIPVRNFVTSWLA